MVNYKLLYFLLLILLSCKQPDKVEINTDLPNHPIFPLMDKVIERNQYSFDPKDSLRQSTNLESCYWYDDDNRFYHSGEYICAAYLDRSKKLTIELFYTFPNHAEGVKIRYLSNSYRINAFTWNHTHTDDYEYPVKLFSRKLILNRLEFKSGDSLFGYVYLRGSSVINERPTGILLQGHFRTKIYDRDSLLKTYKNSGN